MSENIIKKNTITKLSGILKLGITIASLILVFVFCLPAYAADQYSENVVPKMTSATSPSPFIVTSDKSYLASNDPYKAFDHSSLATNSNGSDYWYTLSGPASLTIDIGTPKRIQKINLTSFGVRTGEGNGSVKNWNIFGSNDGNTFTLVSSGLQENTLGSVLPLANYVTLTKSYEFENNNSFRYYKFQIVDSYFGNSAGIAELEMFEKVTTTPNAPANPIATPGDKTVTLNWDAVDGTTGYNVKWGETSGNYTKSYTVQTATYNVPNLTNGTTYYFVVSALNGISESANSIEVSATPYASEKLKLVLEKNEEKQLSVTDDLTDNADMTWTSSDTSIATVDANGKVKALKPGNTIITSTSKDGSYTETINVLVVDLDYQLAVDLVIGDTCRLTVDDLTNTANVTWTADDTTIATVSSKGKVTAVGEGLTYVTATDASGNEIGRIYIRVRK